jgi:hypothetical protein
MTTSDGRRAGAGAASGAGAALDPGGASSAGAAPIAGRVPDFFIVGHEKCGTTALYKMLRRHPQVYMSEVKEPRFFTPELRSRTPALEDEPRPETLEQYLALFARAQPGQRAGEASPQYLRSAGAARAIAAVAPDARIVAIVREPASFLRSVHVQAVQAGREPQRDLRKALALEDARREGRRVPRELSSPDWLLYSRHVRYVEQLRRFHAEFPPERVLVLVYDDYRDDNEATVRKVQRFLEIDDTLPVAPVQSMQTVSTVRFTSLHPISRRLRLARHRPEVAGPIARSVHALSSKRLRVLWRRAVYTDAAAPDEQLTRELRRRFAPEVQALSEYLDRDLVSLWGYDRI